MKVCGKCKVAQHVSNFNKHKGQKDGLQNYCRKCNKENRKKWASENPEKRRKRKLWTKYKITTEEYNEMLANQNNSCAICGTESTRNKSYKFFPVDHCHETGKVRALLCDYCNVGLGRFEDDPERLRKAADYLEKHKNEL